MKGLSEKKEEEKKEKTKKLSEPNEKAQIRQEEYLVEGECYIKVKHNS